MTCLRSLGSWQRGVPDCSSAAIPCSPGVAGGAAGRVGLGRCSRSGVEAWHHPMPGQRPSHGLASHHPLPSAASDPRAPHPARPCPGGARNSHRPSSLCHRALHPHSGSGRRTRLQSPLQGSPWPRGPAHFWECPPGSPWVCLSRPEWAFACVCVCGEAVCVAVCLCWAVSGRVCAYVCVCVCGWEGVGVDTPLADFVSPRVIV